MGASGVDVQLSPAAKRALGGLAIECKNVENLNVVSVFWEHCAKYPAALPLLISKRNKTTPLCTLRLEDFIAIYSMSLDNATN